MLPPAEPPCGETDAPDAEAPPETAEAFEGASSMASLTASVPCSAFSEKSPAPSAKLWAQ
jgi:hypothetical protein